LYIVVLCKTFQYFNRMGKVAELCHSLCGKDTSANKSMHTA